MVLTGGSYPPRASRLRTSGIPPPPEKLSGLETDRSTSSAATGETCQPLVTPTAGTQDKAQAVPRLSPATSNQINQKRRKQKTDYENLILLQKIQNVKPSKPVMTSFAY